MKTKSLSLTVTLIMMIVVGGFLVMTRLDEGRQPLRSNDPMPYIYYYSDLHHAFVIERADGTDSRLLGQGIAPDTHNTIDWVGWSPSGRYLAWRSHQQAAYGGSDSRAWLVSTDGTSVGNFWDDAHQVFIIEWAPDKDWLFVAFSRGEEEYITYLMIDVPNNRIVHDVRFEHYLEYADSGMYKSQVWADDGSWVIITTNNSGANAILRLHIDGVLEQWIAEYNSPYSAYARHRMLERESLYEAEQRNEWVFTDLLTGETRLYDTRYVK